MPFLAPKDNLTEADVGHGCRMLLFDGIAGWVMAYLTLGPFLVAFALQLGASNRVIGLLAAVGPIAQLLQIPSVYLVEKLRRRKALAVGAVTLGRMVWLLIAAVPFAVPRPLALPVFLALLFVQFALGNVANCAFNSWIRDLVPERILGRLFGKRLAYATVFGVALSLTGGWVVDKWTEVYTDPLVAYSIIFAVGAAAGLLSSAFLAVTPEPRMSAPEHYDFFATLRQPFRDAAFRPLLIFMGWWSFTINFAGPFFAVYLIQRLDFSMTWVLGFTVLSQSVNVFFFQLWGSLADRISNKKVLLFTGTIFIFTFLLWPFTTLPGRYVLTVPILLTIHILAGIATAGMNLCGGNLALKLAPYGKAGTYLAVNAMITGLAAAVAPISAGLLADAIQGETLTFTFQLTSGEALHPAYRMTTVNLAGLDFIFIAAFFFGLFSLHRLLGVVEKGEVKEASVRRELFVEMGRMVRQASTVEGMRQLLAVPTASYEAELPQDTKDNAA